MVKSRSAVLRDPDGPYSIESLELDEPGSGEVLVRVVAAGMCHTDILGRAPVMAGVRPAVLGHEGAGVVESVGSGVTKLAVGDHVVMSFDSCGECRSCMRDEPAYCDQFVVRNLSGRRVDGTPGARGADGAEVAARWFGQSSFAELSLATERNLVKVDPALPLELLGPLGCGIQTGAGAVLKEMRLQAGSSIVVFGAGAVGLAAVMAAKVAGATDIVAVDIHESRRSLALELGAHRVVDGTADDVVSQIIGDTGGLDYSFDTTGISSVMASAVTVLRRPGKCVLVGAGTDQFSIPPSALAGIDVTFCYEGSAVPQKFIPELIDFYDRGLFPFDRLVTYYSLDDIDRAELDSAAGAVVKPVLVINPLSDRKETVE